MSAYDQLLDALREQGTVKANVAAVLAEHVEHFRLRVMEDAFTEATAAYWLRRADQFEWARPTLDDFAGNATDTQRRAKWHELAAVARACRARASVSLLEGDDIEPELEADPAWQAQRAAELADAVAHRPGDFMGRGHV